MDAERQVRVFVSSTFRDMHAERDHLVTVVFPELRERVEQLRLEFFDVDLRFRLRPAYARFRRTSQGYGGQGGVSAKDLSGETANSWEYCRQWIDRVEPFFACILGQHHSWVTETRHFSDTADRQRQEREPRCISDLEARHAVLNELRGETTEEWALRGNGSNSTFLLPESRLEACVTLDHSCGTNCGHCQSEPNRARRSPVYLAHGQVDRCGRMGRWKRVPSRIIGD